MTKNKIYLAAVLGTVVATGALAATSAYAAPAYLIDALNLSEEEVTIIDQAHELRQSGDREGAHELIETLDLDREEIKEAKQNHREAVHQAVENGDYESFTELTEGSPRGTLTEAQFETLTEAHALKEAGDHEGTRSLLDAAGIEKPAGKHGHKGDNHGLKDARPHFQKNRN